MERRTDHENETQNEHSQVKHTLIAGLEHDEEKQSTHKNQSGGTADPVQTTRTVEVVVLLGSEICIDLSKFIPYFYVALLGLKCYLPRHEQVFIRMG